MEKNYLCALEPRPDLGYVGGMQPATKISILRDHMAAGRWREAIRVAARFPRLGAARNAILDAQGAYNHPSFYRQIGRDPQALIEAGKAALIEAYGRTESAA